MASRYEVQVTIMLAKDLKNVNWRHGQLKPYAVAWIDSKSKSSTRIDDEGDTNPYWDQTLVILFNSPIEDSVLYVDVVHANADEDIKPLVDSIWVYGNSFESFLVAVINPKQQALERWAEENGVTGNFNSLCENPIAKEYILGELARIAKENKLKGFEFIKAVHLDPVPFDMDRDLLTPTFKKKRPQLLKYYQSVVDNLYKSVKANLAAPAVFRFQFVVRGFRFSSSLVSTGCVLGSLLWFLDSGSRSLVRAISESRSLALWFSGFVVCRGSFCLWFLVFWFLFSDSLDRNPSFAIFVRDSGPAILVRLL
ncbi:long-chain-fatty-acid--CoA ligase [Sarracenia purpurea var. burkii]